MDRQSIPRFSGGAMLTFRTLVRYGIFGLPLAFAGLPIYIHMPRFYADILHMDLTVLGSMLLVFRLMDAFIDPLIGWASDRLYRHSRLIMALAVPVFIIGYGALFYPLEWAFVHPALWLGGCLGLVYSGFSTLMINYYAAGVGLAETSHDHTRIAGVREGAMLLGVLLAALLPALLLHYFDTRTAYALFGFLLAPVLVTSAAFFLSGALAQRREINMQSSSFLQLLTGKDIRWILTIGFLNAAPTAITSTLFLFFTHDVLQAERYSGPLLALYFMSAAAGMPVWSRLSFHFGKKYTLLGAMLMAILCFIWAAGLGAGDVLSFAAICVLSGLTLGADSMLLPAILGDALKNREGASASGFGLWNFTSKLAMAFAAGLVLPLLARAGYHSAAHNSLNALTALSRCYAVVPCLIKSMALLLLYFSPLDPKELWHA